MKYFYHFREDFINPYGMAHAMDSFSDTKLTARLKRFNCEFFVRPTIALSEFCDTILQNMNYISTNIDNFDITQIQWFINKLEPLYPHLEILNRKTEVDGNILILLQLDSMLSETSICITSYEICIKWIQIWPILLYSVTYFFTFMVILLSITTKNVRKVLYVY